MRALLEESFRAAVAAADPLRILAPYLPSPPQGRTFVAAAGKAAASMALAAEKHFPGELEGIAITRYGHGLPTRKIRVIEAGHPVPDETGEVAAGEILRRVKGLGKDDLLLALLSGGGSSLLSLPAEGISVADLQAVTTQLLRSGATIQEINTVRKHLSAIQGGTLAAACRPPVALISGGECTVTLRSEGGRGGRCAEFLLSLAIELQGLDEAWAMAADTDGIDGSEDNAGAFMTPDSVERASSKGLDAKALLAKHDSYGFFSALGDLLVTGPTRTNVNDYRAIVVA